MLQGIETLAGRGKGGNFPASAFQYGDQGSAARLVRFDNDDFFANSIHKVPRPLPISVEIPSGSRPRRCAGWKPGFPIWTSGLRIIGSSDPQHNKFATR